MRSLRRILEWETDVSRWESFRSALVRGGRGFRRHYRLGVAKVDRSTTGSRIFKSFALGLL